MLVQISHRNLVNKDLISAVLYPKGNAFKRLRDNAIEKGLLIDATAGRKTRSVIILTTGQVILTAQNPEILQRRINMRSGFKRQGSLKNEYKEEEVWDFKESFQG
jgi:regulator of extracellular matrix RemA (YlzA/DUF370 family)